jgi:hypothetical protein
LQKEELVLNFRVEMMESKPKDSSFIWPKSSEKLLFLYLPALNVALCLSGFLSARAGKDLNYEK